MDIPSAATAHPKILLTGAAGFLGRAIVNELLSEKSPLKPDLLVCYDLQGNPGFTDPAIRWITGDVRDVEKVQAACQGIDIVIHTAAVVDWGTKPEQEILDVNYGGTLNVLKGCLSQQVPFMVYTSSLDAIYTGQAMRDINETIPYPDVHPNSYCKSKYLSEKKVREANNNTLKTCILRPSDIYGEGDPFHIGSLIDMARGGFYVRLGDGSAKSQHVYVGNMAWAHVLAAHALFTGNPRVPGSIYFITDGPPSNFFHFFDRVVERAGYKIWPANLWIPANTAMVMGALSEGIARLVRPVKKYTPKFSRFAVRYTCNDFTFKTSKAGDEFGFYPLYSQEESIERTVTFYQKARG